jgi:hypothetical protein
MNIVGPVLQRESEVEAILRSLPLWFGIEKALLMYVADCAKKPTFAAEVGAPLEIFPEPWNPRNPALQLVKLLQGP